MKRSILDESQEILFLVEHREGVCVNRAEKRFCVRERVSMNEQKIESP